MKLRGRAWTFGDDVSTDAIVPGAYLKLTDLADVAPHVMEGLDPTFAQRVRPGDIVVGGRNFGKGSSRESAPGALKQVGVSAIVAVSFGRIFFRNAINFGLPVLECPDAGRIHQDDELEIEPRTGLIRNVTQRFELQAQSLPEHILELIELGGLVPYLERWVAEHRGAAGRPT
jgi:3-isopropylmalate/(R)-2-methylmalate dehydratase small subunit